MRLFFGIPLPHDAEAALESVMATVPIQRGWHPVVPRNWHITLSFLGEVDNRAVNALVELGERVAADHECTAVTLDSLQWWPSDHRPRLLAAVASASEALQPMRKQLNRGLRELGIDYEGKPLRAHVTLLRLERGVHVIDPGVPACDVAVAADHIALYVSEGGSRDKIYRPLWQQALVAPPPFAWPR